MRCEKLFSYHQGSSFFPFKAQQKGVIVSCSSILRKQVYTAMYVEENAGRAAVQSVYFRL